MDYELNGKRVWVAGHGGMVGSAICRALDGRDCDVVTAPRREVDLRRQGEVEAWMKAVRPQAVFLAAARVGGILANDMYPADFLYDNLMIEANIIHQAHQIGVEKLVSLGSSCIYPKFAAQPIHEDSLLTGPLEPTNEWYAVAKIAGIKLCQAYRKQFGSRFVSAMPTNLYGPNDNFHPKNSHVLPALMRRIHEAKQAGLPSIELWGSGTPRREFLHVDDLARALVFLMENYDGYPHVNVGYSEDVTIFELAQTIAQVIGWNGDFTLDHSKPDGTPRKLMDSGRLRAMGWRPEIALHQGISDTYRWFLENAEQVAARGAA